MDEQLIRTATATIDPDGSIHIHPEPGPANSETDVRAFVPTSAAGGAGPTFDVLGEPLKE